MTHVAARPEVGKGIDQELLAEAERQISAPSPQAAINEALRVLVETARAKRLAALAALRQMAAEGAFDFSAIDAKKR